MTWLQCFYSGGRHVQPSPIPPAAVRLKRLFHPKHWQPNRHWPKGMSSKPHPKVVIPRLRPRSNPAPEHFAHVELPFFSRLMIYFAASSVPLQDSFAPLCEIATTNACEEWPHVFLAKHHLLVTTSWPCCGVSICACCRISMRRHSAEPRRTQDIRGRRPQRDGEVPLRVRGLRTRQQEIAPLLAAPRHVIQGKRSVLFSTNPPTSHLHPLLPNT